MSLRWFTVLTYWFSSSCSRRQSWGDFRPSVGTACHQQEPAGPPCSGKGPHTSKLNSSTGGGRAPGPSGVSAGLQWALGCHSLSG